MFRCLITTQSNFAASSCRVVWVPLVYDLQFNAKKPHLLLLRSYFLEYVLIRDLLSTSIVSDHVSLLLIYTSFKLQNTHQLISLLTSSHIDSIRILIQYRRLSCMLKLLTSMFTKVFFHPTSSKKNSTANECRKVIKSSALASVKLLVKSQTTYCVMIIACKCFLTCIYLVCSLHHIEMSGVSFKKEFEF